MLGFDEACNRQRRTLTWLYLQPLGESVARLFPLPGSHYFNKYLFSTYPANPMTSSVRSPYQSWGTRRGPAATSAYAAVPFVRLLRRLRQRYRNQPGTIRRGRPSLNRRSMDRDCRAVRNEDGSRPGKTTIGRFISRIRVDLLSRFACRMCLLSLTGRRKMRK